MPGTMNDILALARQMRARRDWLRALKIYRLVLEAVPQDYEVRLNIGDALMAIGEEDLAVRVWLETFRYDMMMGQPIQAIVAARRLMAHDASHGSLLGELAAHYHAESEHVGRTSRAAPADLDVPVRDDVQTDYAIDQGELARQCADLVTGIGRQARFPERVPPIPILSDLPADLFCDLLATVRLLRLEPETVFLREGENAETFYMLARGRVRIYKSDPMGRPVQLAQLGEGSILGEMALLTASPRTASVSTIEESDLLEFSKRDLTRISEESIQVEAALDRFTRERLISNLLATNPLFAPFDRKQRYELLSRFTVHEVVPGTVLVKQGSPGQGLFVILYGEVDVVKHDGEEEVLLATLKAGDVFGEISLIKDQPTIATVRALRHSTVLFLPREYFSSLVTAIPELKEYFDRLSEQRLSETARTIEEARFREGVDIVFDDERIMI
jgi:CRP-like cAMP-binding protein